MTSIKDQFHKVTRKKVFSKFTPYKTSYIKKFSQTKGRLFTGRVTLSSINQKKIYNTMGALGFDNKLR